MNINARYPDIRKTINYVLLIVLVVALLVFIISFRNLGGSVFEWVPMVTKSLSNGNTTVGYPYTVNTEVVNSNWWHQSLIGSLCVMLFSMGSLWILNKNKF
ncbi:hypothetical protein ACQKNC_10595 [Lysinibacillus sp. NPDC094177]|uniref:hypothetical protein n=1 Tax=Lysinibacillus sp. NPDC094177 TaxID=3390580 RepID=UPI003D088990